LQHGSSIDKRKSMFTHSYYTNELLYMKLNSSEYAEDFTWFYYTRKVED